MITKSKFIRYVTVQASGVCNMWSPQVEQYARITKEEKLDIIRNYEKYEELFDVHVTDYNTKPLRNVDQFDVPFDLAIDAITEEEL